MRDSMLINDRIAELTEMLAERDAEIKRLKDKYESDFEDGWYWAYYDGLRQIGLVEDGEIWFVGRYEPVPLSECEDISLIIDPLGE